MQRCDLGHLLVILSNQEANDIKVLWPAEVLSLPTSQQSGQERPTSGQERDHQDQSQEIQQGIIRPNIASHAS